MIHDDCGENCPCARRAFAEASRMVWRMPVAAAAKRFKLWSNGGEPPKPKEKPLPDPDYDDVVALLMSPQIGMTSVKAKLRAKGTKGTVEDRVRQALAASDGQRSFQ